MRRYRLNETREQAIIDWVKSVLAEDDISVIWDKEDAYGANEFQRPEFPYVLLNIFSGPTNLGYVDKRAGDLDGQFFYRRYKSIAVSVNLYAEHYHLELIEKLADSLDHDSVLAAFKSKDIYYISHISPNDVSALLETGHELRAMMEITFGYSDETTDKVGEITSVDIGYEVNTNSEVDQGDGPGKKVGHYTVPQNPNYIP